MRQIHLIRHGQTEWNAEGRWQGALDVPLSAHGRAQAAALAGYVKSWPVDRVYSSDLSRAAQTAEAVAAALGLPVQYDARMREINLGIFQGLTHEEHRERYPELVAIMNDDYLGFQFPGGESRRQLAERARAFFDEAARDATASDSIVVTHGGPVRMLLVSLFGDRPDFQQVPIANTSITTLDVTTTPPTIIRLGDTPHLRHVEPTPNTL